MGYRSAVRIITTKKGFEELKKFNDNNLKDKKENYSLLDECSIMQDNNKVCYFGWDWVKWYEGSYPAVDAISDGLNHLADNDYSYRFARIGENYDDYEESCNDSEEKEDEYLEFPSMIREFDDDYVLNNMIEEEKEVV